MTALSVIEHAAVSTASAAASEVLTFRLGSEQYGIDILAVQEIRHFEPPTRIAQSAWHLLGVLNLRGVIMPVVDLRRRLGLSDENGLNTVTVIVNVAGRTVGLVVDAVSEVLALDAGKIQPRPALGSGADFIVGLAPVGDPATSLLLLVDLAALLHDL